MKTKPSNVNCGNINAIAMGSTHAWSVQRYHHREFIILIISSSATRIRRILEGNDLTGVCVSAMGRSYSSDCFFFCTDPTVQLPWKTPTVQIPTQITIENWRHTNDVADINLVKHFDSGKSPDHACSRFPIMHFWRVSTWTCFPVHLLLYVRWMKTLRKSKNLEDLWRFHSPWKYKRGFIQTTEQTNIANDVQKSFLRGPFTPLISGTNEIEFYQQT